MRQYFNEFNATNEQEIGPVMLDGVSALRESPGQIEDSSVSSASARTANYGVHRNTGGPKRDYFGMTTEFRPEFLVNQSTCRL